MWPLLFILSVLFCAYTLIGYPLLLAALARGRGKTVHKEPLRARVTVILPVHNGERWIADKLDSILRLDYPAELVETLVLSDGCTDATDSIIRQYEQRGNVKLMPLPRGGKAAALNAGIAAAQGEILFFTDVRQELSRDSVKNLVACFADQNVGVVSGELIIRDGSGTEEASVGMYWKYEKWIRKQLTKIDSVMGATGCIYAMRKELAHPLPLGTLVDDMYLPLAAFFAGYRVILDDSAQAWDYPTLLQNEFRRKVRTLAGVYQVIGQYPALLGPRNRMWIHFVSHKVARLIMPWAMMVAFLASFGLPQPWNRWALGAQAFGYALAITDFMLKDGAPFKRLTSPARTFVVLMAASLCAVAIFFIPADRFWGHTQVATASAKR